MDEWHVITNSKSDSDGFALSFLILGNRIVKYDKEEIKICPKLTIEGNKHVFVTRESKFNNLIGH